MVTNPDLQWFPYAVWIESENAWFQATFFYESIWNFIGVGILIWVYYKSKVTGTTTATYLIWYGIGRAFIEGLRTDSLYIGSSGIRVSQLLSMLMVIAVVVVLIINTHKKKSGKVNG